MTRALLGVGGDGQRDSCVVDAGFVGDGGVRSIGGVDGVCAGNCRGR